jgi:hypothetical protein
MHSLKAAEERQPVPAIVAGADNAGIIDRRIAGNLAIATHNRMIAAVAALTAENKADAGTISIDQLDR